MDAFANSWIDCMKLVIYSTVPDILPFFKAESGNTGFKLGCRILKATTKKVVDILRKKCTPDKILATPYDVGTSYLHNRYISRSTGQVRI